MVRWNSANAWATNFHSPGAISFTAMAKARKDETVMFSWIVYKSRKDRDRIMKKIMADKRLAAMMDGKKSPFDCTRMAYGGFKTIVGVKA